MKHSNRKPHIAIDTAKAPAGEAVEKGGLDVRIDRFIPTQAAIAARAYQIYLQNGQRQGRSQLDWATAERSLEMEGQFFQGGFATGCKAAAQDSLQGAGYSQVFCNPDLGEGSPAAWRQVPALTGSTQLLAGVQRNNI